MMDEQQALLVARDYCTLRTAVDGFSRKPEDHVATAQIMAAWFRAFKDHVDRGGTLG
jgi:hypothetical protein